MKSCEEVDWYNTLLKSSETRLSCHVHRKSTLQPTLCTLEYLPTVQDRGECQVPFEVDRLVECIPEQRCCCKCLRTTTDADPSKQCCPIN